MLFLLIVMYLISKAYIIGHEILLMMLILVIGIMLGVHYEREFQAKQ